MSQKKHELALWALRNAIDAQHRYKMARVGELLEEVEVRRKHNFWRRKWVPLFKVTAIGAAGTLLGVYLSMTSQINSVVAGLLTIPVSHASKSTPPAPSVSPTQTVAQPTMPQKPADPLPIAGAPLPADTNQVVQQEQPRPTTMPTPLVLPSLPGQRLPVPSAPREAPPQLITTPAASQPQEAGQREKAVDDELAKAVEGAKNKAASSPRQPKTTNPGGVAVALPSAPKQDVGAVSLREVSAPVQEPDATGFAIVAFLDGGLMVRTGQQVRHVAIGEALPNGKVLSLVDPVAKKYNTAK